MGTTPEIDPQEAEVEVDELFGSGRLLAVTDGSERSLIVYSKARVPEFAVMSRVINELIKGREPQLPEEDEKAYCTKCGAPLPDMDAALVADQWEAANIAGSLEYSRMMQDDIDSMTQMVFEPTEDPPAWIRRNKVNNAIRLVEEGLISPTVVLKELGELDPDGSIQSFAAYNVARQRALANYGVEREIDKTFPYPAWISRSLVNWRMRGSAND